MDDKKKFGAVSIGTFTGWATGGSVTSPAMERKSRQHAVMQKNTGWAASTTLSPQRCRTRTTKRRKKLKPKLGNQYTKVSLKVYPAVTKTPVEISNTGLSRPASVRVMARNGPIWELRISRRLSPTGERNG